jgi:hypothetical protein
MEEALRFISDNLKNDPKSDALKLIESAGIKFDLSPLQMEFLIDKYLSKAE